MQTWIVSIEENTCDFHDFLVNYSSIIFHHNHYQKEDCMELEWNLLCLDDTADLFDSLRKLRPDRCHLFQAASLSSGRQLLKEQDIHLVLVNASIMQKNDPKGLEKLRGDFPPARFFYCSRLEDISPFSDFFNSGLFDGHLPLPLDPGNTCTIIDQALSRYVETAAQSLLIEELTSLIDEMKFLHEISQKISEKKPLSRLLRDIMESSKLLMKAEASSLLLYDSDDDRLHFYVATGEKGRILKKFSVDIGEGIAGWVAQHKESLLVQDCYSDSRFNPDYDRKSKFITRSMIAVPMVRKKRLLGVIEVINKKGNGTFTENDLKLFETLASHCAIAIENHQLTLKQIETEALERELDRAREIQEKLLPASLPEYRDIEVAATLIPAKTVGGDYYNIIRIDETRSLFFVADVTGKGIPAALIVSTIYSCIGSYLKLSSVEFDLMTLVTAMNRLLIDSTTETRFASAWFGLLHHDTLRLLSVNAGHNPPMLFRQRQGKPMVLDKGGLFLGGMDVGYESEEISMRKNDVLVFFTDGVTEAWNTREDEYGEERLISVVQSNLSASSGEILVSIEEDVRCHVGKAQQSDDFTCAVLKIL